MAPDGDSAKVERRLQLAIFVTTFAVYLLSSGRERPWGDANVQYMVAQSLLDHGGLDVRVPWPDDMPPGRDGKFYSTWPVLTSLVQVPGLLLYHLVTAIGPKARGFAEPLTSHLAPSLFGALTCVIFFRLCRRHRSSRRGASLATVFLAFGTTIWVYAHYSYSEIEQAFCFSGFLLQLDRALDEPDGRAGRRLGLWAGLLFGLKYIYAVAIVGGALLILWTHRQRWRSLLPFFAWAAALGLPFLALTALYNLACWGSPFQTGYHPYFEAYWGENPMTGLWGIFLSPGKSLFLYSPPLVIGVFATRLAWREHRRYLLTLLVTLVPVLLVYSRYKLNGDYAWGPRFVVFAVPALMLPFAWLLDAGLDALSRAARRAFLASILAAGVAVQLLGLSIYWDHFIRISMDARIGWLGTPNRKGAIIPVRANGKCDSCFEDVHQLEWLPPFQPILGQWWLLKSLAAGRDWKTAQETAPWRRHTSLTFNLRDSYDRARLDWWVMLWWRDFVAYREIGIALGVLMLAAASAGGVAWWRRTRERSSG